MLESLNPAFLAEENAPVIIAELPVIALLGITETQADALKSMSIETVFDLATSFVFTTATELVSISRTADGVERQLGILSSSLINTEHVGSIESLPFLGLAVIRGLTDQQIENFNSAFGIQSVLDLSRWPGYLAARDALGFEEPQDPSHLDPAVPEELVPTFGEHPSEKYYYHRFLVHDDEDVAASNELDLSSSALNLGASEKHKGSATKLRVGALLSFQQTWTPQAHALGNVLHSLALAPGETTNIAVIDWSRKHSLSTTEEISKSDQLQNIQQRARAISEVTDAVAYEAVTGESALDTESATQSSASSGYSAAGGASENNASSNHVASATASSTSGQREMSSSMAQDINDRTSQHASSSRNRRATVVRESVQRERETLSTRNITNYNHMHALSVQYFEVVQVYNVAVGLTNISRCLYVPFKSIETWSSIILERYHQIWVNASLTPSIANSLVFPSVRLRVKTKPRLSGNQFSLPDSGANISTIGGGRIRSNQRRDSAIQREISAESNLTGISLNRSSTAAPIQLPPGVQLKFKLKRIDANDQSFSVGTHIPLVPMADISEISFEVKLRAGRSAIGLDPGVDSDFIARLWINDPDRQSIIEIPIAFSIPSSRVMTNGRLSIVLATVESALYDGSVLDHFKENARYYNRKLIEGMTESDFARMMECYSVGAEPLLNLVEPTPVAVTGGHLIFRLIADKLPSGNMLNKLSEDFIDLEQRILGGGAAAFENTGLLSLHERRIPVATGGTFVEAVQGRANSAEKIDLTRWWNWQESPIPLSAPEIEALNAKSRSRSTDLASGGLSDALISLSSSSELPPPNSLSQLVAALGRSDLFDDMSGVNQAIEAAQNALSEATRLSTATGNQSSASLAAGLQMTSAAVEKMVDVVSKFVTTLVTAGVTAAGLPAPEAATGAETSDTAETPDNNTPTATDGANDGGAGVDTDPAGTIT